MVCAIKCRCEQGGADAYGTGISHQQMCQSACNLKDERDCSGTLPAPCDDEDKCRDCWAPVCAPPPPTPTTPPPTPTLPPPPGCWGVCIKDSECPQNTTPPLVCPGGTKRCVNPNCPTEQDCTCPPLLCLDLTADKDVTSLEKGDTIQLTCKGRSGADHPIHHMEFRVQIDGGSWTELGNNSSLLAITSNYESLGERDYIVPQTGNYRIECRACMSQDSTDCSSWGGAQPVQ